MKKSEVPKVDAAVKNIKSRPLDINQETVATVLKQLEKFEREKISGKRFNIGKTFRLF